MSSCVVKIFSRQTRWPQNQMSSCVVKKILSFRQTRRPQNQMSSCVVKIFFLASSDPETRSQSFQRIVIYLWCMKTIVWYKHWPFIFKARDLLRDFNGVFLNERRGKPSEMIIIFSEVRNVAFIVFAKFEIINLFEEILSFLRARCPSGIEHSPVEANSFCHIWRT